MAPNQADINNFVSDIYINYENLKTDNSMVGFDILSSFQIIEKTTDILKKEPAVLQINTKKSQSDFVIVGDIHGSLDSLIKIFKEKGTPKNTQYLFLGDYVDRGNNSCEVIILLYSLKCLYPDNIHLIRGNHEFEDITNCYGFKDECISRVKEIKNGRVYFKGKKFYKSIIKSFEYLPICAILNDSIFCVHGGITSLIQNRDELLNMKKVGKELSLYDSIQTEFLWNDPNNSILTYKESERGIGSIFGQEALDSFLKNMKFELVIRGHQRENKGYNWPFGELGGILTVFSAIDYCGFPNDGGVAVISKKENDFDEVEVFQLTNKSKNINHFLKIILNIIIISCIVSFLT